MTSRAGRSAAAASRGREHGVVQRPAKRERGGSTARARGSSLRRVLAYLPLISKALLAVAVGVLIFAAYRAAASAAFFQARNLDVGGVSRANADDIRAVVRRNVLQSGVWRADLEALSAELERLPWVRQAIVSRVLPDGLRVRIAERIPRAVVRTSGGRFIWVDDDAVTLGAMSPSDRMPDFFIRGWDESGTSEGRVQNRERMQAYLELGREWETANLSQRVSEINLGDLHDVRVQLAGDDSRIEVRLGEKDFTNRLQRALKVLDEERQTARGPRITYIMALDTRTVIGTNAGAQTFGETASEESVEGAIANTSNSTGRETGDAANQKREKANSSANKKSERESKQEREKKRKGNDETRSQTRPRRVEG